MNVRRLTKLLGVALPILVFSAAATAETTDARAILRVGCNNSGASTECFVNISGEPVGPAACRSAQVRWNSATLNGQNAVTMLTAGFAAGKSVHMGINDEICLGTFPTFNWFNMQ
jgi:hypothetical protein